MMFWFKILDKKQFFPKMWIFQIYPIPPLTVFVWHRRDQSKIRYWKRKFRRKFRRLSQTLAMAEKKIFSLKRPFLTGFCIFDTFPLQNQGLIQISENDRPNQVLQGREISAKSTERSLEIKYSEMHFCHFQHFVVHISETWIQRKYWSSAKLTFHSSPIRLLFIPYPYAKFEGNQNFDLLP